MSAFSALLLVIAAGMLFLGVAILVRERSSTLAERFQLLTLTATLWLGTVAFMLSAPGPEEAVRWSRASYVGLGLLPAVILHFSLAFLPGTSRLRRWTPLPWALSLVFVVLFQGTDLFLAGVERHSWGYFTHLTPAGGVFVVFFVASFAAALALLRRTVLEARRPMDEARARNLFLAFAVGSVGLVDFLPSFGLPIFPVGFIGVIGFLVLAGRALWKYRLAQVGAGFAPEDVLATIQDAVLVTDFEDRVRQANPAALRLLGWSEDQLIGQRLSEIIISPFNVGRASDTLINGGSIRDRAMVWRRADTRKVEVEVTAFLIRDELGAPAGTVYVAQNVSDRLRAARIEYQAFHDALTGLPNRTLFRDVLGRRLEEKDTLTETPTLALLYVDLDEFKLINDSLGHSMGDRVLQQVASRLRNTLRTEDFVSRIAGDEFAALVEVRDPEATEIVAEKMVDAIAQPFAIAGDELFVTVSVGIAHYPEDGEDGDSLFQSADSAMYGAKQAGGNGWRMTGDGTAAEARQRLDLTSRLHRALERDELVLHYQPIIDLDGRRAEGAEALLRWRVDGRLRKPLEFLEVAEATRLIVPIGAWVLEEACRRAATWQSEGQPRTIAVNLSIVQLQDSGLLETVEGALSRSGLDPGLLELEITETAAVKSPRFITNALDRLADLGVRIAMDDFGTGYSSLSYLQRFPLDIVKIDQMFTSGLGVRRRETAIIDATLAMARALGLEVTAEGVESLEQIRLLCDSGCPRVQGFAICEPLPEDELLRFFDRRDPLPTGWSGKLPASASPNRRPRRA